MSLSKEDLKLIGIIKNMDFKDFDFSDWVLFIGMIILLLILIISFFK